ncbi:MAG TPA: hypothetical protein DD613_05200 [Firmicutes bacterium]|nr:hypothetical protein [Bacillota bacterium]
MGLFGKIKNIFYDEEIVDVPEEPKSVEKPKIEEVKVEKKVEPIKRETPVINTTPTYSEREIFTRETTNTFKFPMLDEEEVKPVRTRVNALESARMEKKKEETEKARTDKYKDLFKENTTTSSKPDRIFKPSPVISPVYGVLDKNYTREEIIERQENITRTTNPKDMNYDAVRRKAYGTLEDELESTLSKLSEPEIHEKVEKPVTKEEEKSIEDLLNEIEGNRNMSIGDIEEKIKDKMEEEEQESISDDEFLKEFMARTSKKEEEETIKEEKATTKEEDVDADKTLEHDLFNLIDSMYEDKEGE